MYIHRYMKNDRQIMNFDYHTYITWTQHVVFCISHVPTILEFLLSVLVDYLPICKLLSYFFKLT